MYNGILKSLIWGDFKGKNAIKKGRVKEKNTLLQYIKDDAVIMTNTDDVITGWQYDNGCTVDFEIQKIGNCWTMVWTVER